MYFISVSVQRVYTYAEFAGGLGAKPPNADAPPIFSC